MRRKTLLLMLLLLSCIGRVKADELTVYDGTTTNNYVPAYIYYFDDFTRSQIVIPSADLEEMAGGTITSIKFYTNSENIPYETTCPVDVYLKEVNYTVITAYEETASCTTVYQGTLSVVTEGEGGSLTITFSTPFTYEGGNLLIGIENTDDTDYRSIKFYGQTVNGASISGSNGNSLAEVPATQRNFLPKTTFTYERDNVDTPRPKSLKVDDVAGHTATLSWTAPSTDVTGYVYQYKKAADTDWSSEANTTATSVTLSELAPETKYNFRVKAMYDTEESKYATLDFTTTVAVFAPTSLVVSNIAWNQADVSWTDTNGEGTTWMVAYSDELGFNPMNDECEMVSATTTSATLEDLSEETTYEVYVIALKGGEYSLASPKATFTTPAHYPMPTNVAASDITTSSATIDWTAQEGAVSYDLRYRKLSDAVGSTLTYDFEDGTFQGWTTIDADGDGYTWELGSNPVSYMGAGIMIPGRNGSNDMVVSGSYSNIYYELTPDNYLVSPQIMLGGTITFWACAQDEDWPTEHFGVAVSTRGNTDPRDFITIWESDMTAVKQFAPVKVRRSPKKTQGTWYDYGYEIDLSAFSGQLGYVAIRHFDCVGMFLLDIDDITIEEGAGASAESWTTIEGITGTSQELTGLDPDASYEVQVQANYAGSNESKWTESLGFHTEPIYVKPTNLKVDELQEDEAVISWVAGQEDQMFWDIAYKAEGDADFTVISGVPENSYTLIGLIPETTYTVKVRGNHGEGEYSLWTNPVTFTTYAVYAVPFNLATEGITHTSATLTWKGVQDTYDLRWRPAAYKEIVLTQDFEDGLGDWQAISNDTYNSAGIQSSDVRNGEKGFYFESWNGADDFSQFLISPVVDGATYLEFYYSTYGQWGPESFVVGYSTTGNSVDDFTWDDATATSYSGTDWKLFTCDIPEGTQYIAIRYTSEFCAYLYIDDITILGEDQPAGEWQLVEDKTSPYKFTDLEMGTDYEWQVMGNEPDTEWSESAFFTTLDAHSKFFIANGDWDDDDNWLPNGVPTVSDDVTIQADATVHPGVVATAKTIAMDGGSITIRDGGELKTKTEGVPVTYEKEIEANKYYLLASPVYASNVQYVDIEGLMDINDEDEVVDNYDVYHFVASAEKEWYNLHNYPLSLNSTTGFLYAKESDTTLRFTGETYVSSGGTTYTSVPYDGSSTDFYNGWKLVGNPFPCTCYVYCLNNNGNLVDGFFYKMNDEGTFDAYKYVVKLAPGESAFIQVFASSCYAYFSTDDLGINPDNYHLDTFDYPTMPTMGLNVDQDAAPTFWLSDSENNNNLLNSIDGYSGVNIGLDDRTIWSDDSWNTICFPFSMSAEDIANSPIAGFTIKELDTETGTHEHDSGVEDHTLYLNFKEVDAITAGKPYIVKKQGDQPGVEEPVFNNVTVNNDAPVGVTTADETFTFQGIFNPLEISGENRSLLYLGSNSMLYYPNMRMTINAFRAYFALGDGITAGDPVDGVRSFVVNFGDDEPTSIGAVNSEQLTVDSDAWYDLSGRKVKGSKSNGQLSRGIYVSKGHKVLVKSNNTINK